MNHEVSYGINAKECCKESQTNQEQAELNDSLDQLDDKQDQDNSECQVIKREGDDSRNHGKTPPVSTSEHELELSAAAQD